jgi:phosphate uptake regulator
VGVEPFLANVDAYKLLRVLEEVSDRHARTVRALDRVLNRLRRDIENEELQMMAKTYLRRLRVLRQRLERSLQGEIEFDSVDEVVRDNVATLSEYMIIVGYVYEEDVLRKVRILAKRGAHMLQDEQELIQNDIEQLSRITSKLQEIVDKYY